jgi:hypothetical protein
MNDLTRKDTIGSLAIVAAILVSTACALFTAEVEATSATRMAAMCEGEA